jgi:hypothetical protein
MAGIPVAVSYIPVITEQQVHEYSGTLQDYRRPRTKAKDRRDFPGRDWILQGAENV